jgi:hypothetical protein
LCRDLDLSNNLFANPIPTSFSKLTKLQQLDFSNNNVNGNLAFAKHLSNLVCVLV